MKKFYLAYEQSILFFSIVTYLMSFMFIFNDELQSNGWYSILWIAQFIILGVIIAKRSIKKGWKWPERF